MQFDIGSTYQFSLSNHALVTLCFEGFGENMKQHWRNIETDEIVHTLPPYKTYTKVSERRTGKAT